MGWPLGARATSAEEASGLILKEVHVTAVVVSHDGGSYLPRTLAALADQTRPADAAIGVDTGSRDNSAALLAGALGADNVVTFEHAKGGFGGAVRAGLAALAPFGPVGVPTASRAAGAVAAQDGGSGDSGSGDGGSQDGNPATEAAQWLWLLHDDAAPAPEALAELLHAVERAPSVTVAGCKQVDWDQPRRLVDVGLSTSRWAERLSLIEADELDQGQYDGRSDTFAVNSAGMLVRRDVWEQLKGFDPALPGTGDDVDLCWRNRLAGNRVVVVPSARMFHVGHRPHGLGTASAARKAQVHLRLKHSPWWAVPLHAVGALLGSLLRVVLSIAVKDPGYGVSQLGATLVALGRPVAIWRARRNAAASRRVRRSVIKGLQTSRREVWAHRRSLMESIGADDPGTGSGVRSDEPSGDSTDDFAALATNERGWVGTGAVAAGLVALAASLVGLLNLIRAETATGGALLPISTESGAIWQNASSWWIGLGAGLPGHGDPFDYVLWVLSVVGAGNANAALVWLLFLAMPLAGLGAWFAAAALTTRRRFRFAAALVWAGAPALQIALNQGRIGALVAHIMMPLLVLALLRATGSSLGHGRFAAPASGTRGAGPALAKPGVNGMPSWTTAAAAGLALAVVTACAPSLLLPAAVVIVCCGVLLRRRGRTVWWALLPSAALFVPFAISTADRPRALLGDPGLPLGFDAAPLWQQLLGQPLRFDVDGGLAGLPLPGDSGVPWALLLALLVGGPVVLLAVSALFVPGRNIRLARFLWAGTLIALAAGWLTGHVATGVNADLLVTPFTGPAVSAGAFTLLGAALIGAENLQAIEAGPVSGGRRILLKVASGLAVAVLVAGPMAALAAWTTGNAVSGSAPDAAASQELGTARLVQSGSVRGLPATAADRGQGPEQTRTLLISGGENGEYTSSLVRGAGTTLDILSAIASARNILGAPMLERIAADDSVVGSLRSVVATIVAGTGVDPRPDLEQLGVGFVVLSSSDTASQLTASRIDAVPGLVAVGKTDSGWLWRVASLNPLSDTTADAAHRARIVDGTGKVVAVLESGSESVETRVPDGEEGRLVVLAERSDPGWTAWLDGRKLTSTTSGWAQAFTLPASGGDLAIRYTSPWTPWLGIAQAVVLGLTLLLAIPLPAPRPHASLSRDENSLRKEYSNA